MNNLQRWNKSMQYKKKKQKQFLEIQCRKKTKIFQSLKIISTSESLTSIQGSMIRLNIYSNSNENQRNNDNEKYIHRKRA